MTNWQQHASEHLSSVVVSPCASRDSRALFASVSAPADARAIAESQTSIDLNETMGYAYKMSVKVLPALLGLGHGEGKGSHDFAQSRMALGCCSESHEYLVDVSHSTDEEYDIEVAGGSVSTVTFRAGFCAQNGAAGDVPFHDGEDAFRKRFAIASHGRLSIRIRFARMMDAAPYRITLKPVVRSNVEDLYFLGIIGSLLVLPGGILLCMRCRRVRARQRRRNRLIPRDEVARARAIAFAQQEMTLTDEDNGSDRRLADIRRAQAMHWHSPVPQARDARSNPGSARRAVGHARVGMVEDVDDIADCDIELVPMRG